jgi:hypothetical protein
LQRRQVKKECNGSRVDFTWWFWHTQKDSLAERRGMEVRGGRFVCWKKALRRSVEPFQRNAGEWQWTGKGQERRAAQEPIARQPIGISSATQTLSFSWQYISMDINQPFKRIRSPSRRRTFHACSPLVFGAYASLPGHSKSSCATVWQKKMLSL